MKKEFEVNEAKIEIELTREVVENNRYFEGYDMGKEKKSVQRVSIKVTKNGTTISANGEEFGETFVCSEVTPMFNKNMYSKGARGRIGDAYVGQELYDAICKAYAELDAEVTKSEEYVAIEKKQNPESPIYTEEELAKMPEEIEQNNHLGYCHKCHSYCYGDCEA